MGVYSDVLDLQKTKSEIDHNNALTQLDQMRAQQTMELLKSDQAAKDAYRATMLAQQDAAQIKRGETPDAEKSPIDENPQLKAINKTVADAQSDYDLNKATLNRMKETGASPETIQKLEDNAAKSLQEVQVGQQRMLAERKEVLGRISSVAGSADRDTFPMVKAELDRMMPGWDRDKNVDFNKLDGQVVWGANTANVMKTIQKQGETAYQQTEAALKIKDQELREAEIVVQRNRFAEVERYDRAKEKFKREGLDLKKEEDAAKKTAADKKDADKKAADAAKAVYKEPTKYRIEQGARTIADERQLPMDVAKEAYTDMHRMAHEFRQQDPSLSLTEAENKARDEIYSRITDPSPAEKNFVGYTTKAAVPAKYVRPISTPKLTPTAAATTTATPVGAASATPAMVPGQGSTARQIPPAVQGARDDLSVGVLEKELADEKARVPQGEEDAARRDKNIASLEKDIANRKPPVKVASKEDAAKLPSGTRFVTPDGRVMVRK